MLSTKRNAKPSKRAGRLPVQFLVQGRKIAIQRGFPLPASHLTELTYAEGVSINPGSGVLGDYVFNAGGLYDPNTTGTGHQPYGFDQMMTFYNHFVVLKASCRADFVSNVSAPFWGGIHINDSSTTLAATDYSAFGELPRMKRVLLAPSPAPARACSMSYSAEEFFHCDPLARDELQGSASANPTESAFFHVLVGPQISTDDLASQVVNVTMKFLAYFTEPKTLAQS